MKSFDLFLGEQKLQRDIERTARLVVETRFPINKFVKWFEAEGQYLPPELLERGQGFFGNIANTFNAVQSGVNAWRSHGKVPEGLPNTPYNQKAVKVNAADPRGTPFALQARPMPNNTSTGGRTVAPTRNRQPAGATTTPTRNKQPADAAAVPVATPPTVLPIQQQANSAFQNAMKSLETLKPAVAGDPQRKGALDQIIASLQGLRKTQKVPQAVAASNTSAAATDPGTYGLLASNKSAATGPGTYGLHPLQQWYIPSGAVFSENFAWHKPYSSFKGSK